MRIEANFAWDVPDIAVCGRARVYTVRIAQGHDSVTIKLDRRATLRLRDEIGRAADAAPDGARMPESGASGEGA